MTDLELKRALQDLSNVRSDTEPVVTLYLDTRWSAEKQRERARVFVQEEMRLAIDRHAAHPQLEGLRRSLARVAQVAGERSQQPDGESQGLAVFACQALGLWRVLDVPQPFEDELCVDGRPHLLQLARLRADVEPALVAFVSDRGARIYEVVLGAIVAESALERDTPRRHGEGGRVHGGARLTPQGASGGSYFERAGKDQRHVEAVIERVRREAIELMRQRWERDPRQHLVFVGTAEKVAQFERDLPQRMREKVLARLPRPPGEAARSGNRRAVLVEQVVAKLAERERSAEQEQVEHAIGEALRGGLAVVGPEDVVLAVNERRVHKLIVEEDFERSGWRCRNCGAIGMTHDEVCSFCQGPLARVSALGEELMGRVLAEDGEVEVVAHQNRLHSYKGVAALLRQSRATGLSGQAPPAS
jgi:peptide subunit release factor 1 (eRF1)